MASNNATFSVIGSDVTISGDVAASADLHVDGTVEGDLSCASLVQGESSHIRGAITADSAKLAGEVSGTITVKNLTITKTARITGDVSYDSVTVEQGAQIDGRLASQSTAENAAASNDVDAAKLSLAG